MPTPFGHSLTGYIIYTERQKANWKIGWKDLLVIIAIANLPDIDYLPGFFVGNPNRFHHGMTHSIAFAVITGAIIGLIYHQKANKKFMRYFLLFFSVYMSHLILDFFGKDTKFPYGEQLFWPVSKIYVMSPIAIFSDIHKASSSRIFIQSLFNWHNLTTVIIEGIILLPIALYLKIKKRRLL